MDNPLKAKFSNLKPKPYHLDLFDCTVSVVIGDAWQEKAHPSIRHISGSMDYISLFEESLIIIVGAGQVKRISVRKLRS